jgi:hypothetical protein
MKKQILATVFSFSLLSISLANTDKKLKKQKPVTPNKVEQSQTFELKIKNGHLGKVILGINPKASDAYDRGLDDMAPPPGMQTGYTALVSADKKYYLYRDTRKNTESIEWIFYCKVYKKKAVTIFWDKKKLLAGYKLVIEQGDKITDMSKKSSLTLTQTTALLITAKKIKKK